MTVSQLKSCYITTLVGGKVFCLTSYAFVVCPLCAFKIPPRSPSAIFFFFRTVIHITHSPFCTCTDSVRLKSARFSKKMSLDTQGKSNGLLLLHLLNSQQNQITEFEEEAFVAHAKTQACPEGNMMFPAGKGQLSN